MKQELIGPTASLTAALLSKVEKDHDVFTQDVVASAFEAAYFMLLAGMERVDKEIKQQEKLQDAPRRL